MSAEQVDAREEQIGRVLNEYLDRLQRGEPVSEAELIEAHPGLADELRAHFGMVRQVSSAASGGAAGAGPFLAPSRDALPGYEILGEIHRGGQGVVYQATQKATQRTVAIKVMREGPFAGWRDRARFEREVQLLAALKHPGIVTIHDSGTAGGCHFFVMDYIQGLPLDAWVSRAPRSVEQILRLFVTICEAVNAAHLKGIIHRDLKPGNIRIDEQGRPHILDFGLAKVAGRGEHDDQAADMTVVGQFVGSLPWTSPEQAQGQLDQVDTRTDVYALGVVLYQILTGAFPYEVAGPMRDVLNRIVASEPVRPSAVRKGIDRDVEAMVLKCLRKEPERRYQTAGELGRDLERHLNGEPVAARSDSGWYVMAKTLRRYRVPVAVAGAFAALIGVSLIASVSLWRQAVVQRDRAVAAQREQDRQRSRADAQAAEAERARQVAERERARAQAQAERLRRVTYLNEIALARNAREQGSLIQAQQMLETCPPDLRGWEWYYLRRLSTPSPLLDVSADPECVVALAVSPDGRRVATGGSDGVVRVWDSATGVLVTQLTGHAAQVNALAFSPDGRHIASGGRDRTLRLWDWAAGSHRVLLADTGSVNCVCFSPDGAYLVSGGQSRVLTFRSLPEGRIVRASTVHQKEISCVAYSPDGKHVVSGELMNPIGGSARIRIWDAATVECTGELAGHPGAVLSVVFSPDGRHIASGGGVSLARGDAQGTLKVFDAATGEELLSLRGHEGFVDAVAFSPDGKRLATAGAPRTPALGMEADHTLKIWDAATGAELCTYPSHRGGGRAVAWSPDGGRVYSAGMDGRLKAWLSTPAPEARVLEPPAGQVLRIAFSPDGRRLAACGLPIEGHQSTDRASVGAVRVWDLDTDSPPLILAELQEAAPALAWSPDGKFIAAGGVDRSVRLWDSATGTQELLLNLQDGTVQCVAFAPEGDLLASAAGQLVILWGLPGGKELRRIWHSDTPMTVSFSPDGRWMACGSQNGQIRVWDRESGDEYYSIAGRAGLNGAWFSPDSTMLASAHSDGTIVLWEALSGAQLAIMSGPQRSVQWLDFSPDGRRLAACTSDLMLKLWDTASASEVYAIRAHDASVLCVRFSPDGTRLATCGQDGLIKLWEAKAN